MTTTSTEAAIAALRAADVTAMSRDETARLLGDVRKVRSWLDTIEMAGARHLRELNSKGEAESAESLIAKAGGRTGKDAEAVTDRSDLCNDAPEIGNALAEGDVTTAHLDAINNAARRLPDDVRAEFLTHSDDLLARASRLSLEGFSRECHKLAKFLLAQSRKGSDSDELDAQRAASKVTRWVDKVTGMHHTHLELDPVRDSKLNAAFNAELARLRAADGNARTPWQQMQVNAFLNAIAGIKTSVASDPGSAADTAASGSESGASAGSAPTGAAQPGDGSAKSSGACHCGRGGPAGGRRVDRVPEVTLLVSYEWLVGQATGGVCETENGIALPISTARRLCCDAEIIPALLGTRGELLELGRSARTATEPQRRALRAMHRGCAHPDCNVGFDSCRIHHIKWWWRDTGPTDIDNLIPVCEQHHHLVHEGGWTLTMAPDRTATWTRPDGQVFHTGSTIDRTEPRSDRSPSRSTAVPSGSDQPTLL